MWKCPKCGEEVEQDFEVCWNCGTTADGVPDGGFEREADVGSGEPLRSLEERGSSAGSGCFAGAVLSIAALLSLLGSIAAVFAGIFYLTQDDMLGALVLAPLAFVYQIALFIVFVRVQKV